MGDQQQGLKAVILCGGKGTRLGERGNVVPKALVPIGGRPILWHLLNYYSDFGIDNFVLCLGHLGGEIAAYFDKLDHTWQVECVDTGQETNTGGRLNRVRSLIDDGNDFFVTYGDGLADVDLARLLRFHRSHGRIGSITTVHPHSNFGIVDVDQDGSIERFREKPILREWINGGFFVFQPEIFQVLDDNSILEREPFEELASQKQLMAYPHEGFWKCMDTFKDNLEFEQLWNAGAPWARS